MAAASVIIITNRMDIKDLTQAMDEFVQAKGWYAEGSSRLQTPRNITVSLNLEAAEILEHFHWSESPRDPQELAGELADVALYLLQLANLTHIDLENAILEKLKLNYTRTWDNPE